MNKKERNEIIFAIINMIIELQKRKTTTERLLIDLTELSDIKLIIEFFNKKAEIKKRLLSKKTNMFVSKKTYDKMESILKEHKVVSQMRSNSVYLELVKLKQSDFSQVSSVETDIPLFDAIELSKMDEERKDQTLAICLYYLMEKYAQKANDDAKEKERLIKVIEKIKKHFPHTSDFYGILHQTIAIEWSAYSEEERLKSFIKMLAPFLTNLTGMIEPEKLRVRTTEAK